MFFYQGQTCPVCGRYFAEHDDIVTCPECGAPHHRECWKQEGHCHYEHLHGTDKRWDDPAPTSETASETAQTPPLKKRCLRCGYENPEFSEFCAQCGMELTAEEWQSAAPPPPPVGYYATGPSYVGTPFGGTPFVDPYGGVPRTETIDGVSVDVIAQVVGVNAAYYLPRFHKMSKSGKKISWNWAAFWFGYNWLLYRKNFVVGSILAVVLSVVEIVHSLLTETAASIVGVTYVDELITRFQPLLNTMQGRVLILLIGFFSLFLVLSQVLLGLFGNYLYMRSVVRKAKKWQQSPPSPYSQNVFKTGGVSFFIAILPDLILTAITVIWINIQSLL